MECVKSRGVLSETLPQPEKDQLPESGQPKKTSPLADFSARAKAGEARAKGCPKLGGVPGVAAGALAVLWRLVEAVGSRVVPGAGGASSRRCLGRGKFVVLLLALMGSVGGAGMTGHALREGHVGVGADASDAAAVGDAAPASMDSLFGPDTPPPAETAVAAELEVEPSPAKRSRRSRGDPVDYVALAAKIDAEQQQQK